MPIQVYREARLLSKLLSCKAETLRPSIGHKEGCCVHFSQCVLSQVHTPICSAAVLA